MGEYAVRAVYGPRGGFQGFAVVSLERGLERLLRNRAAQGVRDFTYPTREAAEICAAMADPRTVPNTRYRQRIFVKCP